jgi:hypothetical protein
MKAGNLVITQAQNKAKALVQKNMQEVARNPNVLTKTKAKAVLKSAKGFAQFLYKFEFNEKRIPQGPEINRRAKEAFDFFEELELKLNTCDYAGIAEKARKLASGYGAEIPKTERGMMNLLKKNAPAKLTTSVAALAASPTIMNLQKVANETAEETSAKPCLPGIIIFIVMGIAFILAGRKKDNEMLILLGFVSLGTGIVLGLGYLLMPD